MKKGIQILLCMGMLLTFFSNNIFAFETTKLETAYEKVLAYYEEVDTLYYLDEVIALGNAGVDVSEYKISGAYDVTQNFKENLDSGALSVGNLAKHLIACIFMKENPKDVNDTNLEDLLHSFIKEDGSVEGCLDASDLVWVVYALKVIDSEKSELVADKLASYQMLTDTTSIESMDNDKGGYGLYYVSLDTSAWVIEALSLVNKEKYASSINLALSYLERKQMDDGGYKPNDTEWEGVIYPASPNTDSQSSVIRALLSYDKENVIKGKYDKNDSIFSIVLENQLEDGSFSYMNKEESNEWSTYSAALLLSTYFEGSFVENANAIYKDMNSNNGLLYALILGLIIIGSIIFMKQRKD